MLGVVAFFSPDVALARTTAPTDAFFQNAPDGSMQSLDVGPVQGVGRPQWVQPGIPQHVLDVDVADAGQEGLVQEIPDAIPTRLLSF